MRPRHIVVGVVSLVAGVGVVRADTVTATWDAPLELTPPRIAVAIGGRVAVATVTYDVVNPSDHADEAIVEVVPPAGAVIDRMRMRTDGRWLTGELIDHGAGASRYQQFLDAPYAGPRGPALLERDGAGYGLRLMLVPARGKVGVEYGLRSSVCYAGGRWIAPLPDEPDALVSVRGAGGVGRVLDAAGVEELIGRPLAEACADQSPGDAWSSTRFAVTGGGPARGVRGSLTLVPVGTARVAELTVDLGAELASVPRDLAVVFVVDASKSMGEAGVAAQLELIRAYLRSAPRARFEVVVYRRFARRLFGALRPGAAADRLLTAAVAGGELAPANGSDLDAGLALAAEVLARARGTRRLVGFTDDRLRDGFDDTVASDALAGLPADAVAHLLVVGPGSPSSYDRDFDHWLAPVAARWGGVAGQVGVAVTGEPAEVRTRLFEELVRPRRLERLTVTTRDGAAVELGDRAPGDGARLVQVTPDDGVTVTGFIWGRTWQPDLDQSERARRRTAALAFGDDPVLEAIPDQQRADLARFGHVVSADTSLLALDPRWRPGGLPPEVTMLGMSFSSRCGGPFGTMGTGRLGTRGVSRGTGVQREHPDLAALLAGPVRACAARHHVPAWNLWVELETTGREVVDVAVTAGMVADLPGDTEDRFVACAVEAAWALDLGPELASWTYRFEFTVEGGRGRAAHEWTD